MRLGHGSDHLRTRTPPAAAVWVAVWCGAGLFAAGCRERAPETPIVFKTLEAGLEYASLHVRPDSADASVGLHILRFAPETFALEVVTAAETGAALADAHTFRKARRAIAAVNGGLFDPKFRPLGLLVSGGKQLGRLRKVDHAVFTISSDGPGMQHAKGYKAPKNLDFAIECGPRLVVNGRPLSFKQRLARRTAIAYDGRGRVVLVVSGGVLRLGDLAAFLARSESQGGLGVVAALNLDGGSSTMLDLAHGATKVSIRAPIRVPIGLALVGPGPAKGSATSTSGGLPAPGSPH